MAIMNENIAQGKWSQVKGKIKEAWGDLTDDDIEKTKGNLNMLTGLIQQKYGEAQDGIRSKLNALVKGVKPGSETEDIIKDLSTEVTEITNEASALVKEYPFYAVLGALVAGFIAGTALRWKRA